MATITLAPYQVEMLTDAASFKLLHGGRGSGKTKTLVMAIYNKAVAYPGSRICVVCNDYVQMRDSTLDAILDHLNGIGCPYKYRSQSKIITLPNGTTITLLTFDKDKTSLKGAEWDAAFIDEADGRNTTEEKFDYLIDGVRGKLGDRSVTLACNPVPPGHFLAERFFINPRPNHKGWRVSTYDNATNLPTDYIPRMEAKYPKGTDEHKRWMMGDLVSLSGAVYKTFGPSHIVTPSEIPSATEAVLYGQDLGVHDPHVLLEGRITTGGMLYITREYYVPGKAIDQHIPDLKRMYEKGWPIFSDHSATQHSIMQRSGFNMVQAYKDVSHGIQMLSARFIKGEIKISTDCQHLIRELYNYCWRESTQAQLERPDHKFSHAPDALRYLVAGLDKDSIF